jgi:hypothetical protein
MYTGSACGQYAMIFFTPWDVAPNSPYTLTWYTDPPTGLFFIGCSGPASGTITGVNINKVNRIGFGFNYTVCHEGVREYDITYNKWAQIPFSCTDTGGGRKFTLITDGTWKNLYKSSCVAPNNDTKWDGEVTTTITGMKVEGVMVKDGQSPVSNTAYENGPNLWVHVKQKCDGCTNSVNRLDQCGGSPSWCCMKLGCLKQSLCILPSQGCNSADCKITNCYFREQCTTKRFCEKGCLLMCFAMIGNVDPVKLNADIAMQGGINGNSDIICDIAAKAVSVKYIGEKPYSEKLLEDIICKESGKAIVNVGGHFVVVTGRESSSVPGKPACRYAIADPRHVGPKKYLDEYIPEAIKELK